MMNKRIHELAEIASHQSPDGYPVTIEYNKDFVDKFAELIVRECMFAIVCRTDLPPHERALYNKVLKSYFGL
jgi:hypothetical protein